MPFSHGPKNCVGQNFGLVVLRSAFSQLLGRFRLELHTCMGGPQVCRCVFFGCQCGLLGRTDGGWLTTPDRGFLSAFHLLRTRSA